MRGKADVPVSDVPVTTPQLRCRPVVRARLGPQLRAVPGLPRRMGKPCAGASGLANSREPRALRADRFDRQLASAITFVRPARFGSVITASSETSVQLFSRRTR
jgi:hypothetical protein